MIPLAITYLRRRASFYSQMRRIYDSNHGNLRAVANRHSDKVLIVVEQCDRMNDCLRCSYAVECLRRYDYLVNMTGGY